MASVFNPYNAELKANFKTLSDFVADCCASEKFCRKGDFGGEDECLPLPSRRGVCRGVSMVLDGLKKMQSCGTLPRILTLSGESGCGKTMLAKEAFYLIAERTFRSLELEGENWESVFSTVYNLAESWRGGDWLNERVRNAFFLVIDDLGAERDSSGFVKDKMFELLNARMGKWTLITTNLSLKNIAENYDARIASRLIRDGNTFMRINAGDYWLLRERGRL